MLKKVGFTLAEVLITLGIIGVVAAITIPTLIARHQQEVKIVKLKKIVSMVEQALKMSEAEHGDISEWSCESYGTDTECNKEQAAFFKEYFFKYIRVNAYCGTYAKYKTNCENSSGSYFVSSMDGRSTYYYLNSYIGAQYVITNGAILAVSAIKLNSGMTFVFGVNVDGPYSKPIWGRNSFNFYTQDGKSAIDWAFSANTSNSALINYSYGGCNKKNGTGQSCITLIVKNGWSLPTKDDFETWGGSSAAEIYPW